MTSIKSHKVWDSGVRWFHWINVLCVTGLIAIGVVILNAKLLGVSNEGKILLKTVHVWVGYVFMLNLSWRIIWAFIGGRYSRWSALLPFRQGYVKETRDYITNFTSGRQKQYLGHNPLGRIAVTLLIFLLFVQGVTGLVLAGTDIYYPPIGSWIANWIAAPGIDPAALVPYSKELYDEESYKAMRAFRKPFITIHYYGFYTLLLFIVIHIFAVVITELKEGVNLVSAMFSGKKVLTKPPEDEN
ncbi:MAG: cytochrome B [Piscirickettsiaceae bacterium]|nr:MAG: cytochrome B [Piscirickettsiaceae bacterium]